MKEYSKTTAISFTQDKEAALYFDYVIPIFCNDFFPAGKNIVDDGMFTIVPELLPPNLIKSVANLVYNSEDYKIEDVSKRILAAAYGDFGGYFQLVMGFKIALGRDDTANNFLNQFTIFTNKFNLLNIPILFQHDELEEDKTQTNENSSNTSLVTLANIPIVDCRQAEWKQLIDFRKDPESRKKLRRLRLFFQENYSGKPKTFIEDDLFQRLDDYNTAIKDWGFKTRISCFSMLLESKTLLATTGATLVSALFGQPIVTASMALAGATLEVSKVALEYAKLKRELYSFKRDHPISYIIDAKKHLEK